MVWANRLQDGRYPPEKLRDRLTADGRYATWPPLGLTGANPGLHDETGQQVLPDLL